MPFPETYNIPVPQPTIQDVKDATDIQQTGLNHVVGNLFVGIQSRLTENQTALNRTYGKITKKISSAITANDKQLAPIIGTLSNTISNSIASNGVALSLAAPASMLPQNTAEPQSPVTQPSAPSPPPDANGCIQFFPPDAYTTYPGGWWIVQIVAGGPLQVVHIPSLNGANFYAISGPYADQATANSCLASLTPPPPPPPAGGGGGNVGGQPDTYWYVCCFGDQSAPFVVQWLVGASPCQGGTLMGGPFATNAQAAAFAQTVSCVDITLPPSPTGGSGGSNTTTTTNCPQPQPGPVPTFSGIPSPNAASPGNCTGIIPSPGTAQFCNDYIQIKDQLVTIGNAIAVWVNTNFNSTTFLGDTSISQTATSDGTWFGEISAWITNWLNTLKQSASESIQWLLTAYNYVTGLTCNLLPCNVQEVLALTLIRAVINMLKRVRLGTDLALWATLDLTWDMPQLERVVMYFIESSCPTVIPSINQAINCYLMGTIGPQLRDCWILLNGGDPAVWQNVMYADRSRRSADEAIRWGRQNGFTDEQIKAELSTLGWIDDAEATSKLKLYHIPVSLPEYIGSINRGATNEDYAAQYNLDTGFAESLWSPFGNWLRSIGIGEYRARLAWRTHWANPSQGQLAEMLYRLRSNKPGVTNVFTADDYDRMLAEVPISPYFRPLLAEIAYRLPQLRYYRQAFQNGIVSATQFNSYFQDIGFDETNAGIAVQNELIVKARVRATQSHGWTPAALAKAYASQQIGAQALSDQMSSLGYTQDESNFLMGRAVTELQYQIFVRARSKAITGQVNQITKAIAIGVMDDVQGSQSLQRLGFPQSFSDAIASSELNASNLALVSSAVKRIRSAYLQGEIDLPYVQNSLTQLGIVQAKIAAYIAAWQTENTPNRRRRTGSQIVADVASGSLTAADAYVRLHNLGYPDADIQLFMADAAAKVAKAIAAEARSEERAGQAQAKALAAAVKQAALAQKDALAALKRMEPVSHLQKWVALGLRSKSYFTQRMEMYGYTPQEIEAYYDEACSKKGAACTNGSVDKTGTGSGQPGK